MPVIDNQRTAGKIHVGVCQRNPAGCRGDNGRADRRGDVDAQMRSARLTIQNTLTALDAGNPPFCRPDKPSGEMCYRCKDRARVANNLTFGLDAQQGGRRRRDHFWRESVYALDAIFPFFDFQRPDKPLPIGTHRLQNGRFRRIAPETQDEAAIRCDGDKTAIQADGRIGIRFTEHEPALDEITFQFGQCPQCRPRNPQKGQERG